MKKFFSLFAVFALAVTAMAQAPSMSATFDKETSIISVELDNGETSVTSFTFKFQLPDGVSVVSKYDEDEGEDVDQILRDKNRVAGSKWTWDVRPAAEGKTMVTCYGGTLKNVETTKRIVTIEITGEFSGSVQFTEVQIMMDGAETNLADFTCPLAVVTSPVELKGAVKDGSLVFKFENTSGKTIANCNFKLELPEGITVKPKGKKYSYEEGDATEGMTFSVAFAKGKYTITVYDGEFDETFGNTIISLPLEGELAGQATVSSIAFGDPDGNNISRPEDFTVELADAIKSISAEQTKSGLIYNLNGQRVSKAQKGVFVVDGKKVAVQ